MKIKHAMILAAGLGTRMQPLTLKIPKPLLKIGTKSLLERSLALLINHGVDEISINVHHLAEQIEEFILNFDSKVKINISDEKKILLDTGGGIKEGTKNFNDNPFFVINPDTLWNSKYQQDLKSLEQIYFSKKKPCLLLVNKKLSLDKSFTGDFNIKENIISKDVKNEFIYTGLQIMNKKTLDLINKKIFSMNELWEKLINKKGLIGSISNQNFYHLNNFEIYKKILSLKTID